MLCAALGSAVLSEPALADCSDFTPGSNAVVVCDAAPPNPITQSVTAANGSTNVSVTVNSDTTMQTPGAAIQVNRASTVVNNGTLHTHLLFGYGIWTQGFGNTLTNNGVIIGDLNNTAGMLARTTSATTGNTIVNNGTIDTLGTVSGTTGKTSAGIRMETVVAGTITNSGTVTAHGAFTQTAGGIGGNGVEMFGPGTVFNTATGSIVSQQAYGVFGGDTGIVLDNAGAISGAAGAIRLGSGGDTVILRAGSRISGSMDGGGVSAPGQQDALVFDGFSSNGFSNPLTRWNQLQLKNGATVTLNGTNYQFDSGTIESGSTLAFSDTDAVIGATVNNGALSLAVTGGTHSLQGDISGSGTLTKTGSGTLTRTGTDSYTGATQVSAGLLQAQTANSFSGNSAFTVAGGATLDLAGFNQSIGSLAGAGAVTLGTAQLAVGNDNSSTTFSGTISGSGSIAHGGSGTLILTGANSYTGGTAITGGILQLGDGGTSGGIAGDVANNGSLVFDRSDTVTFSGAISGAGHVTQSGPGVTILTGNNSYAGGTTIAAGVLQLGNGGTAGGIVGDVANNGSLVFNRSDTVTFDGAISGTGTLHQSGGGMTVLTANNSYTGPTSVENGNLRVQGAIASDTAIGPQGTLSGTGLVAGNVSNQGTVAPGGDAPGSLTIGGNYSDPEGTLQIRSLLNAGGPGNQTTDRLLVAGNVTGSTSVVVTPIAGATGAATGNTATSGISIIQVGGTAAADAFVLRDGSVAAGPYVYKLNFFPAGAASEIDPRLAQQGVSAIGDYRLQSPIVRATDPAVPVQTVLESAAPGEPATPMTVTLPTRLADGTFVPGGIPVGVGPNGEQPGQAQVLPQVQAYRDFSTGALSYGAALTEGIQDELGRLAFAPADTEPKVFVRAQGLQGRFSGNVAPDFSQSQWSAQAGVAVAFPDLVEDGDALYLALAAGRGGSNITVRANDATARFDATNVTGGLAYRAANGGYLSALAEGIFYSDVRFGTRGTADMGDTDGTGFAIALDGGYPMPVTQDVLPGYMTLVPHASIGLQHNDFGLYTDRDGVQADLSGQDSIPARIGVRLAQTIATDCIGEACTIAPWLSLDAVQDLQGHNGVRLSNVDFATDGTGKSIRAGAGADIRIGPGLSFFVSGERAFGVSRGSMTAWQGTGGLRLDL